jgi:hypothetical protein
MLRNDVRISGSPVSAARRSALPAKRLHFKA